jgi:hypothetical protein
MYYRYRYYFLTLRNFLFYHILSNSNKHYTALNCIGEMCGYLFKPCTGDSDCGSEGYCKNIPIEGQSIVEIMSGIGLISANEKSKFQSAAVNIEKCTEDVSTASLSYGWRVMMGITKWVDGYFGNGIAQSKASFGICLPKGVGDGDKDIFEDIGEAFANWGDRFDSTFFLLVVVFCFFVFQLMTFLLLPSYYFHCYCILLMLVGTKYFDSDSRVTACKAKGCKLYNVGDSICDTACNNIECSYDGGDCNGDYKAYRDLHGTAEKTFILTSEEMQSHINDDGNDDGNDDVNVDEFKLQPYKQVDVSNGACIKEYTSETIKGGTDSSYGESNSWQPDKCGSKASQSACVSGGCTWVALQTCLANTATEEYCGKEAFVEDHDTNTAKTKFYLNSDAAKVSFFEPSIFFSFFFFLKINVSSALKN